jgi:hypothetical protein
MIGVGGAELPIAQRRQPPPPSGGNGPERLLLALLEMLHVEIAGGFEPALVRLGGERAHETQAAGGIGEDAHHQGAALQLLVEPLQPARCRSKTVPKRRP